jgi:hypothetical protein
MAMNEPISFVYADTLIEEEPGSIAAAAFSEAPTLESVESAPVAEPKPDIEIFVDEPSSAKRAIRAQAEASVAKLGQRLYEGVPQEVHQETQDELEKLERFSAAEIDSLLEGFGPTPVTAEEATRVAEGIDKTEHVKLKHDYSDAPEIEVKEGLDMPDFVYQAAKEYFPNMPDDRLKQIDQILKSSKVMGEAYDDIGLGQEAYFVQTIMSAVNEMLDLEMSMPVIEGRLHDLQEGIPKGKEASKRMAVAIFQAMPEAIRPDTSDETLRERNQQLQKVLSEPKQLKTLSKIIQHLNLTDFNAYFSARLDDLINDPVSTIESSKVLLDVDPSAVKDFIAIEPSLQELQSLVKTATLKSSETLNHLRNPNAIKLFKELSEKVSIEDIAAVFDAFAFRIKSNPAVMEKLMSQTIFGVLAPKVLAMPPGLRLVKREELEKELDDSLKDLKSEDIPKAPKSIDRRTLLSAYRAAE